MYIFLSLSITLRRGVPHILAVCVKLLMLHLLSLSSPTAERQVHTSGN